MSAFENKSVRLCAVGDLMFGDSPKMLGVGVRDAFTKNGGYDYFPSNVVNNLNGDLVFGNLETILSNIGYSPNNFHRAQLRGYPEMVLLLKYAGFNVINIANNHMMQYGAGAFNETCHLLAGQGIEIVGLGGVNGWQSSPVTLSVNGFQVGFLGYANPDNYGYEPLFALIETGPILQDVARLRAQVDWLVVSFHWGDEFIRCPSPSQQRLAHSVIEAGADLILGHHPHVVQRVEKYLDGIICYSLGNFISDMVWNPRTREGLLLELVLDPIKGVTLSSMEKIFIQSNYIPEISQCDLKQLTDICMQDELIAINDINYSRLCCLRVRENRNLAHLFLVKNCFRYSPFIFFQILWKSIKSFLGL